MQQSRRSFCDDWREEIQQLLLARALTARGNSAIPDVIEELVRNTGYNPLFAAYYHMCIGGEATELEDIQEQMIADITSQFNQYKEDLAELQDYNEKSVEARKAFERLYATLTQEINADEANEERINELFDEFIIALEPFHSETTQNVWSELIEIEHAYAERTWDDEGPRSDWIFND